MTVMHRTALFRIVGILTTALISILFTSILSAADSLQLPDGSSIDLAAKCPVCGMVIGGTEGQGASVTYKEGHVAGFHGVAAAIFKDGHVVGFEGARCLFIYNSVPQNYNVDVKNITRQFVTDFTTKKLVDLSRAFLVLGSNVKGPMGYELIPFSSKDDAAKFAAENDGKWIVQLHEVARSVEDESDTEKPEVMEQNTPGKEPLSRPRPLQYLEPCGHGHHGHH